MLLLLFLSGFAAGIFLSCLVAGLFTPFLGDTDLFIPDLVAGLLCSVLTDGLVVPGRADGLTEPGRSDGLFKPGRGVGLLPGRFEFTGCVLLNRSEPSFRVSGREYVVL